MRRRKIYTKARDMDRIYRQAREEAVKEGAQAARNGEAEDANPWPQPREKSFSCRYDHPATMHRAWRLGWTEQHQREEKLK